MNLKNNVIYINALRAMTSNEQMSKQIDEFIAKVDRELGALQDKIDYFISHTELDEDLHYENDAESHDSQALKRITKPFFSTCNGLTPYTNDTERQRMAHGSLDYYEIKSQLYKLCSEKDFELLKESINRNVFDIECHRLNMSKDKVSNKELKKLHQEFQSDQYLLLRRCNDKMVEKIDWQYISIHDLGSRVSAENCRRFCDSFCNPKYSQLKISKNDNKQLMQLADELGSEGTWCTISERMNKENKPFFWFKQWSRLVNKLETSNEWSSEEDELLCETAKRLRNRNSNQINWKEIALLIPNRSARDCERRWNSIQSSISLRPFTDLEEYEMLMLIKQKGSENWCDIARDMDTRRVAVVQRQYCDIVEEFSEWNYVEDRRLWLTLRRYFRDLLGENCTYRYQTSDLNLYKSVMKDFNGRNSIDIRHRFEKLCKWFNLWNQFYFQAASARKKNGEKVISLLTECPEERNIVMKDIRQILQQSTFFNLVRDSFSDIGSNNPDKDANDLITKSNQGDKKIIEDLINKSQNKKLLRFMCAINDLDHGIFIPLNFDDYDRSEIKSDDLRIRKKKVRKYETKMALCSTLTKDFKEILEENKNLNVVDRQCLNKLIECEGTFTSALNYATKSQGMNLGDNVVAIFKILPDIKELMMDYVYAQDNQGLSEKNIMIHSSNKETNSRQQLAELMIYRQLIPSVYKTYLSTEKKGSCLAVKYLPKIIDRMLTQEQNINNCEKNIAKRLALVLKLPEFDCKTQVPNKDFKDSMKDIQLQPPDKLKFDLLRNFLLQKSRLLDSGGEEFRNMSTIRYDHPVSYLNNSENIDPDNLSADKSTDLLSDPRYILLRTRLLSILATTSVAARLSPFACALAGDKLHQDQNNAKCSSKISQSFKGVDRPLAQSFINHRKRKIDESLYKDCQPAIKRKTKSATRLWTKVVAANCKRTFLIPRSLFQSIFTKDFTIESINGVNVDDFMK